MPRGAVSHRVSEVRIRRIHDTHTMTHKKKSSPFFRVTGMIATASGVFQLMIVMVGCLFKDTRVACVQYDTPECIEQFAGLFDVV